MKSSSLYSLLKFVYPTHQWHHSLDVHPLLRKILDSPLYRVVSNYFAHLVPVVQRLDKSIHRIGSITIQLINVNKTTYAIRWIVIYQVDSIMHSSMLSCLGGGGGEEAGHRRGIWTQISFSVQMPGPREVILGQKSANSSLQGRYGLSKDLNKWLKVPTTGRLVTSTPPPYALLCPMPPPPTQRLNIDRCIIHLSKNPAWPLPRENTPVTALSLRDSTFPYRMGTRRIPTSEL